MKHVLIVSVAAALLLLGGCGPSKEQIALCQAMYARQDRQPNVNESAQFIHKYCAAHDRDYVMWAMDYASLCLLGGNYDMARAELLKAHADINKAEDKGKETAAALSNESLKLFKGEPYERAMLCCYLGLLHYMDGDYNNARIFFAQADLHDATTEDDMKDYRNDFALAHYWLGRAFLHLDQPDNARVAFTKASVHVPRKNEQSEWESLCKAQARQREKRMRLEKKSYAEATDEKVAGAADMSNCCPEADLPAQLGDGGGNPSPVIACAQSPREFFSVDYQKEVNLLLFIETGAGPVKYLVGENGCLDAIRRGAYEERRVVVYLDDHKVGPAIRLVDMFHQADTRGTSEKDRAQLAKGITQGVLRRLPYVGSVAAMWDVRADHRFWHLLPGEVHVLAARVRPGRYNLTVQCLDANGNLLPRNRLTHYCVPVLDGRENVYILHTHPEADNQFPLDEEENYDARMAYGQMMLMFQR